VVSEMENNIYQDGTYFENNPLWHQADSPWKAVQVINILNKNNLNPSSISEVGCGAGEILFQLSEKMDSNITFSGYEISPDAFKICSKKIKNNLNFYLKNPLEENGFDSDIVMVMDVLEHIEDYYGFLRNLKTKGKYKVFHIPLELSAQSVLRSKPLLESRQSVGHIHYFSSDTAIAAIKDTGYEIVDYVYTGFRTELTNRGWRAKLLKFPRLVLSSLSKDLTSRLLGGYSLLVLAR